MSSETNAAHELKTEQQIMEHYRRWLNKEHGYTRKTMTRRVYTRMLKRFSERGLKRTNFRLSVKDYRDRKAYEKARCEVLKDWRRQSWEQRQGTA